MPTPPPSVPQRRLARQARQKFVEGICAGLPEVDKTVLDFLSQLMSQTGTQSEMHSRRDAWQLYQQHHTDWIARMDRSLREALAPHISTTRGTQMGGGHFELLSDDVVENKIAASRMALTITEQVSHQLDTVRLRTQSLEGQELDSNDILRPEAVCLIAVEQWVESGLPRTDLLTVVGPLQRELANLLQKQYQAVNVFYVEQGITPQNDLRSRVRRTEGGAVASRDSGASGLASQALTQTREAMAAGRAAPPRQGQPQGMAPVFATGMTPLSRARQRAQGVMGPLRRLFDRTLRRIPLLGNLYGLADRFVGLLDQKDNADLAAMRPVWCFFGGDGIA